MDAFMKHIKRSQSELQDKLKKLQDDLEKLRQKAVIQAFIKDVGSLTDDEQVQLYNALVTSMAAR